MGRRTKTLLPTSSKLLKPATINPKTVQTELQEQRAKQKLYYDRNAKALKPLRSGDSVLMTTKDGKWKPAKVTNVSETGPRSYNIVTPQGQHYRRNRKDLRKMTGSTGINTNIDDFLDDQSYDDNTNKLSTANSGNSEIVMRGNSSEATLPATSLPPVRRSQ